MHGVANNVPNRICSRTTASMVSGAVTLPTVGWGVNGACLALGVGVGSLTPFGVFIVLPVWFGTAIPAISYTAPIIEKSVSDALCEEEPRILGSDQRLHMT